MYVFYLIGKPLNYLYSILDVYLTRRQEYYADKVSVSLGYALPLREAVIRVNLENGSNMNPDKWYSMMKYTHPAMLERLNDIDGMVQNQSNKSSKTEAYNHYFLTFNPQIVQRHGQNLANCIK